MYLIGGFVVIGPRISCPLECKTVTNQCILKRFHPGIGYCAVYSRRWRRCPGLSWYFVSYSVAGAFRLPRCVRLWCSQIVPYTFKAPDRIRSKASDSINVFSLPRFLVYLLSFERVRSGEIKIRLAIYPIA